MVRRNRKLCVQVARDVIAQLRMKRYYPSPGHYVVLNGVNSILEEMSFKDLFAKNKKVTCNVCALGAAFVSLVNIKNECSLMDMRDNGMDRERMEDLFGYDNLNLMESAFECVYCDNSPCEDGGVWALEAAAAWGRKYTDSEKRLIAIMNNVIRNNGDFKLPQKYVSMASRLSREGYA